MVVSTAPADHRKPPETAPAGTPARAGRLRFPSVKPVQLAYFTAHPYATVDFVSTAFPAIAASRQAAT